MNQKALATLDTSEGAGHSLRAAREHAKLTQAELAEKLGKSQSAYGNRDSTHDRTRKTQGQPDRSR
jgi:DNA-binding XRE family transcriptional regulator